MDQDRVGRSSRLVLENGSHSSSLGGDFLDLVKSTRDLDINERDSTWSQESFRKIVGLRLSEKATRFIYSYYMLGRRIRDIAIVEGATSQTIDQRHYHAKKTIAARLDEQAEWVSDRDKLPYSNIRQYDMAALFYGHSFPRKVVAKMVGVNVSTAVKYISKQSSRLAVTEK